ncbi:MAG: chemotaxis protein CheW [Spirochaetaceae bacterium]|nr:chemotaxis protein CheW [Spirochaetaceae bacterium]
MSASEQRVMDVRAQVDLKEAQERMDQIDFKMVTFSLGGKDYGIDIMKIKEIAKFSNFTYVPNSFPYVRGVYNLRGDIISILDLRVLFHLPVPPNSAETENGLILRLEENVLGVVVDVIDKVIAISSKNIQPPHPIFGDINIKYIHGVVENAGRLYIILNADSICSREETSHRAEVEAGIASQPLPAAAAYAASPAAPVSAEEPERDFVRDTLKTFRGFHVTDANNAWFSKRFDEWKDQRQRKSADVQLQSAEDADAFLAPFHSADTGRFWSSDLASLHSRVFPDTGGKAMNVWDVGCGKGYEAYSLAGVLTKKFPGRMIKIWANDSDLLAISTAPNLIFHEDEVPDYLQPYVAVGKNGASFQMDFKSKILFEYHDAMHSNTLPDMDFIVARDVVSFQSPENQVRMMGGFHEKLKPSGVLILGDNEKPLDPSLWAAVPNSHSAYKKS